MRAPDRVNHVHENDARGVLVRHLRALADVLPHRLRPGHANKLRVRIVRHNPREAETEPEKTRFGGIDCRGEGEVQELGGDVQCGRGPSLHGE